MANITSTSEVADAIGVWYSPSLLDCAVPKLIHMQFGMKKSLPQGHGFKMRFGRFEELDEATSALSETTDPDGQTMVVTRMDAKVEEYGDVVIITDAVKMTVSDPILNQTNKKLGEQMGRTLDTLTLDVLVSTGTVHNCVHGGNGNAITEYTQEDGDEIVETLMVNDAEMFTAVVEGTNKFGTSPLDESYCTMAHTKLYKDLKKVSSWVPKNQYPNQSKFYIGERGYTDNNRWCLTSKGSVESSLGYDVYDFITTSVDAYGIIDMEGEGFNEQGMDSKGNIRPAETIYTAPGGHNDRLKRKHSLGWKAYHTCRILNDNWLIRGRCSLAA